MKLSRQLNEEREMLLGMHRNLTQKRDRAGRAQTHPALAIKPRAGARGLARTLTALRVDARLARYDIANATEGLREWESWRTEFNNRARFAGYDNLTIREADLKLDTREHRECRSYGECRA